LLLLILKPLLLLIHQFLPEELALLSLFDNHLLFDEGIFLALVVLFTKLV
jgi:hypothetical protein